MKKVVILRWYSFLMEKSLSALVFHSLFLFLNMFRDNDVVGLSSPDSIAFGAFIFLIALGKILAFSLSDTLLNCLGIKGACLFLAMGRLYGLLICMLGIFWSNTPALLLGCFVWGLLSNHRLSYRESIKAKDFFLQRNYYFEKVSFNLLEGLLGSIIFLSVGTITEIIHCPFTTFCLSLLLTLSNVVISIWIPPIEYNHQVGTLRFCGYLKSLFQNRLKGSHLSLGILTSMTLYGFIFLFTLQTHVALSLCVGVLINLHCYLFDFTFSKKSLLLFECQKEYEDFKSLSGCMIEILLGLFIGSLDYFSLVETLMIICLLLLANVVTANFIKQQLTLLNQGREFFLKRNPLSKRREKEVYCL